MSWADPLGDLRRLLNDSDVSNLVKQKRVFGTTSGQNRTFFTFDDRLVASGNQSVCARPLRVWYDQGYGAVEVAASGIIVQDQFRGEFLLTTSLSGVMSVTAAYFYQQSTDDELNFALDQATKQVNATDRSQLADGLQLACLYFASSITHRKLAQRWQQRKSEQFMLEDEPARKEAEDRIAFHLQQAKECQDLARSHRKEFYDLRQDKGLQPAYALLRRTPPPWTPRR